MHLARWKNMTVVFETVISMDVQHSCNTNITIKMNMKKKVTMVNIWCFGLGRICVYDSSGGQSSNTPFFTVVKAKLLNNMSVQLRLKSVVLEAQNMKTQSFASQNLTHLSNKILLIWLNRFYIFIRKTRNYIVFKHTTSLHSPFASH